MSANKPIAPEMERTAPSTLIASPVTNPANSSAMPNASTIGHGVDAGTSRLCGVFSLLRSNRSIGILTSSTPDNVYDHEDHHPHGVHEMPIHPQNLGASGVLQPDMPK